MLDDPEGARRACPGDKLSWKPHAKSYSLGSSRTTSRGCRTGSRGSLLPGDFDMAKGGGRLLSEGAGERRGAPEDVRGVGRGREGGDGAARRREGDGVLDAPAAATRSIMEMPRIALVRTILLNHSIHHRGQLSVYLRLLDVPVPSIYGPSADENPFAVSADERRPHGGRRPHPDRHGQPARQAQRAERRGPGRAPRRLRRPRRRTRTSAA